MVTDNYKLVPFKGDEIPCDKCPIEDICDAYNIYTVFNEVEGFNSLLDECASRTPNTDNCSIPVLKENS